MAALASINLTEFDGKTAEEKMADVDTQSQPADDDVDINTHLDAEAKVLPFAFKRPDVQLPEGRKVHVKLAGTNSCRASVQVLNRGGENNLHYHPNMDLIYMVLKGRVAFYGPGDKLVGEFGVQEGVMLPEYTRYWFKSVGEEEAHLLQIAGYPRGAKASKRIPVSPQKLAGEGIWFGMSEEELKIRKENVKY
jgi:mannose-6-phosphate isomerase-like protein (cupin superfamily)